MKNIVTLLFIIVAFTQTAFPVILNTRGGLSSTLVNDIYQTRDGQIWIATEEGLNRYDGSKCRTYYYDINDTTSLLGNNIRMTFESRSGDIYVGTLHGLMKYNPNYDRFERVPLIIANNTEMHPYISSIVEISSGEIFIATSGHGLFKLMPGDNAARLQDSSIGFYIAQLFVDSKDNVWVATSDKGNSRISNNGFVYTVKAVNDAYLTSFGEDNKGNIYAGNQMMGLMRHNPQKDLFEPICKETEGLNIKTLHAFNDNLLIGTDGKGLKIYDTDTNKLSDYDMGPQSFNTTKAKVHSILTDKWGNLWLGVFQKGVVIVPAHNNNFNYIGHKSSLKNIIGSNYVSSIYKATDGTLYVGTDNDGIYAINTSTWQTRHYSSPATIMCISEDADKNIWIGTYTEGPWKINATSKEASHINIITRRDGANIPITDIELSKDNKLWISTLGEGIYKLDPRTKELEILETSIGVNYTTTTNKLHNRWINCLYQSRDKKLLYIGSQDGIGCLDIEKNDFVSTYGTNRVLADYTITDFTEDGDGNIWTITNKGLIRLDAKDKSIKHIGIKEGLPQNEIKSVECDKNGEIWGTASNCIFHINHKTYEVNTYYEQDGIVTNEFAKRSSTHNNDYVYFGATDGITYFNVNEVQIDGEKPVIKVTDFYIKGQRVLPSTKSENYKVLTDERDSSGKGMLKYDLSHIDNSFTIELTTTQAISPNRISYLYSINGEPAIDNGNGSNRIPLRNMKPGEYQITVQGLCDGQQSEPIEVYITIHSAIWTTKWAKILYCLIIALIAYVIYKQYNLRRKTRAELIETLHKQEVHDEKMQLFTDIAHEIRTPMSLVISPLNQLMSKDNDPERQKNYDIIERNIQRILRLMTQILDIQKIDAGKMEMQYYPTVISNIIQDVCNTFEFEARAKNINLVVDTEKTEGIVVEVDTRHFDKIITNLVSNAIKYTPKDGEVKVRSYTEGEKYIIEIEDTGDGFSESDVKHIFERFHRTQNAINSGNVGFGVGLDLTNTLVKLHHGTIEAMNCKEHKGGIMRVTLPIDKQATQNETASKAIENNTGKEKEEKPDTPEHRSKYTVLFADDDSDMRKYVKSHLGEHFNVITCNDGQEALSTLLSTETDLVVTDVNMPIIDGFTLCKNIKSNVNVSHIPVIILTSRSSDTDRIESYENGADAYIAKPFNIDVLTASIKSLITRREKMRVDVKAKETVEAQKVDVETAPTLDDKLLERVTNIINKNISNPTYSIEELASDVGYSRVHLHRKMRELTGLTTRDFVRNVRMKYAGELLKDKGYEIADVAVMTGYSTTNYFSQAFRAYYGMTPTTYIEKNKG
ncbi:MAG: response regulator [Bacteroidales bacterium]|nr:response regulator [Bacteroidales bacterium]